MKISEINYVTGDPGKQYAQDIYMCLSAPELLNKLESDWGELTRDAIEIVKNMDDEEFKVFRTGLKKERKGEFAGIEFSKKYADVLMPKLMFEASMLAEQYKAPWGLAFLRLQEKKERGTLNMNVKIDRPPNYEVIASVFPDVRTRVGVIYTYGDVLYNPDFIQITKPLMEHEMVHSGRQEAWGIDQWWKDYLNHEYFRLNEEVMAHVREYETVISEGLGRNHRRFMLKIISDRLSSPMYGNMISKSKAKALIKRKAK